MRSVSIMSLVLRAGAAATIAVAVAASGQTTVTLAGDNVPGFDQPTARAAGLGLPSPRGLDAGYNACAMDLSHTFPPACFRDSDQVHRYITRSGNAADTAQRITLAGTGGVELTNSYSGYDYARTCEYSTCDSSTSHVLDWFYATGSNCTHSYPANDSYVNVVDHGYVKLYNYGYGSGAKNCNVAGIYPSTYQGGGGAFLCYTATCGAFSGRYYSFSLHNS